MKIYPVTDSAFAPYGKVLVGYDTAELLRTLEAVTPLPEGTEYTVSQPELEALPIAAQLRDNAYGGMPVQLGWCNGRNTSLNCLEYHRDSELNIGADDFILLLAKAEDITGGIVDTARVKAFRAPAGAVVEVYATSLHYAPCKVPEKEGFRVVIVLPRGTNTDKPESAPVTEEDRWLWARNKWLLAHPESSEAAQGAHIGLSGENIDLAKDSEGERK